MSRSASNMRHEVVQSHAVELFMILVRNALLCPPLFVRASWCSFVNRLSPDAVRGKHPQCVPEPTRRSPCSHLPSTLPPRSVLSVHCVPPPLFPVTQAEMDQWRTASHNIYSSAESTITWPALLVGSV